MVRNPVKNDASTKAKGGFAKPASGGMGEDRIPPPLAGFADRDASKRNHPIDHVIETQS
jgi:hypothetical protein